MSCDVTSPISTNQICEVGIFKPRCANFQGNTLNDWLKWLAEKECEIDWSSDFNLEELKVLASKTEVTEPTKKQFFEILVGAINEMNERGDTDCCTESIGDLTAGSGWTLASAKVYKRGSVITLQGNATGGNVGNPITTLPEGYRPTSTLTFPVAHEFTPTTTYFVFLRIATTGSVTLFFTGSGPSGASSKVYLDGISFFIY